MMLKKRESPSSHPAAPDAVSLLLLLLVAEGSEEGAIGNALIGFISKLAMETTSAGRMLLLLLLLRVSRLTRGG